MDDPVSKLEHMGKETVKKLADLASAAEQAGVEIDIPENCVQKGERRRGLGGVLKLTEVPSGLCGYWQGQKGCGAGTASSGYGCVVGGAWAAANVVHDEGAQQFRFLFQFQIQRRSPESCGRHSDET